MIVTITYQATIEGFQHHFNLSRVEAVNLIKQAVALCKDAILLEEEKGLHLLISFLKEQLFSHCNHCSMNQERIRSLKQSQQINSFFNNYLIFHNVKTQGILFFPVVMIFCGKIIFNMQLKYLHLLFLIWKGYFKILVRSQDILKPEI